MMRHILVSIAETALVLLYAFVGGLWIKDAIREFKRENYYFFGVHLLLALWFAFEIINISLGGLT